jgi:S1-C subfamily serine protease
MQKKIIFTILICLVFLPVNTSAQNREFINPGTYPERYSNSRTAAVLGEVFQNLSSKPKFKTRGAGAISIFSKLAPSVVLIVTDHGIGSGSVIRSDGLILTNWHVVEDYPQVAVAFMPKEMGQEINEADVATAEVIKISKNNDLALLKLTKMTGALPLPIEIGNQAEIQIGADVHAIGHPGGEFWTYTRGYISQFRPNYEWSYSPTETFNATVIQTQTPINPGNSGGPLINEEGHIIGVNSFKGEGEAINFAVSLNEINDFLRDIPEGKKSAKASICDAKIIEEKRSTDNTGEIVLIDRDCNGVVDATLFIPDDKTKDRVADYDDNEDGRIDGSVYDEKSDGTWDNSFWDTNFDGTFDLEGVHKGGDINPSSYREIS